MHKWMNHDELNKFRQKMEATREILDATPEFQGDVIEVNFEGRAWSDNLNRYVEYGDFSYNVGMYYDHN